MKVKIKYYAMLREAAGRPDEDVEAESGDAVALFEMLKERYGVTMSRTNIRLAVNDAFVPWDTPLNDGDSVVFIPPVAGG